jgi:hypothetical protein
MKTHETNPEHNGSNKDSLPEGNSETIFLNGVENASDFRLTQLKEFYHYLQNNIATASMVSKATGIPQKNLCRYKRDLELANRLWEIEKTVCKHTGFKAWYLTTDPAKAPRSNQQLNLF